MKKYGAKVAREEVCSPKKEGGLGVKNILVWNKAQMIRHLWDLARKKNSLWVKWGHTYMLSGRSLWLVEVHGDVSWTWRKLRKLRSVAWSFMQYKIGNGRNTWLWVDNWHPHGSLMNKCGTRVICEAMSITDARVSEVTVNGNWHLHRALSRSLINCY